MRFEEKVAVVTGAAQSIGEAYARGLAGGLDLLVNNATIKNLAIKRMGQPEDMVGACLFLLSAEAAWVTGQILAVDGGQVFRP